MISCSQSHYRPREAVCGKPCLHGHSAECGSAFFLPAQNCWEVWSLGLWGRSCLKVNHLTKLSEAHLPLTPPATSFFYLVSTVQEKVRSLIPRCQANSHVVRGTWLELEKHRWRKQVTLGSNCCCIILALCSTACLATTLTSARYPGNLGHRALSYKWISPRHIAHASVFQSPVALSQVWSRKLLQPFLPHSSRERGRMAGDKEQILDLLCVDLNPDFAT